MNHDTPTTTPATTAPTTSHVLSLTCMHLGQRPNNKYKNQQFELNARNSNWVCAIKSAHTLFVVRTTNWNHIDSNNNKIILN